MIKNLSQLKKAISEKRIFVIKKHYIKPEFSGQRRLPNVIQTNGFYSVVPDESENPVSKANYGKGFWFSYGKAAEWEFKNDGTCVYISNGKPVWEIEFE